tara:strand:+ start:4551 stop:5081 length:531 start_codon:yes stop_codon:yes gene_type:complete
MGLSRVIIVPHPDDEILFLYSYVKDRRKGDLYYSVTLPKGIRSHYWVRVFGGGTLGLEDKGKYVDGEYAGSDWIPNLEQGLEQLEKELSLDDNSEIIVPGTSYLYGHKHHVQLCDMMKKVFVEKDRIKWYLTETEQMDKEIMFLKEYPDQKHILNQDDIRDYLDFGVEVALVFGVK